MTRDLVCHPLSFSLAVGAAFFIVGFARWSRQAPSAIQPKLRRLLFGATALLGLTTLGLGAVQIAGSFDGPLVSAGALMCGVRFTFASWVALLAAGGAIGAWLPGPLFENAQTKTAVIMALAVSFLVGYGMLWYSTRWEWMVWLAEVSAYSSLGGAAGALSVIGKEMQERASQRREGAR